MTTVTLTLSEFLLERINNEETVARVAQIDPDRLDGWPAVAAAHVLIHAPEHVLAECAAKRQILDLHFASSSFSDAWDPACTEETYLAHPDNCEVRKIMAAVYADHPDYREEWSV